MNGPIYKCGKLIVDDRARRVYVNTFEIFPTSLEYNIILTFVQNVGTALSRADFLTKAWGMKSEVAYRIETRTVDMHISRVKKKLGGMGNCIKTVKGFGYRLDDPSGDSENV